MTARLKAKLRLIAELRSAFRLHRSYTTPWDVTPIAGLRCETKMAGQNKKSLINIELFAKLPPHDVTALADCCEWRCHAADRHIVDRLDETSRVFFIVSGKVRVISYSISGKEVAFRDIGAGGMFGEYAAIDGGPRSADVVALEESLIASMSAELFWRTLRDYPDVAAAILKRLTGQIRALTDRVFEFSTLAVRNRIHAELLRLARDHMQDARSAIVAPAPTHAEIASRVSTHREAVTRELNDLHRAGVIARKGGRLMILDVPKLARMVQEVRGD